MPNISGSNARGGVVVVVVAAGRGSRFGGTGHKLAQSLGDAQGSLTVLGATLQHAIESQLDVVVVTTAPFAELARSHVAARDVIVMPAVGPDTPIDRRATVREGSAPEQLGMGHSIRSGVIVRPESAGWIVLPGDMPTVRPTTLQSIARCIGPHSVCYPQHRGQRGNPVGFSAELYSELARLSGDQGARRIVARYAAHAIEVDDPGVLVDVDTPADLERVRALRLDGR